MSRMRQRAWAIPACLLAALLLGLAPLPEVLLPLRPFWLGLVVAYLAIELPDRIGIGRAFLLGLLADMLYGAVLGEHALRLVVLVGLLQHFRARLRFFPPLQQALAIGALLFNDRLVGALLHLLLGHPLLPLAWWLAPVVGLLLWPLVFVLIDRLRHGRRTR
jgi:rod shape-determining protein MreD